MKAKLYIYILFVLALFDVLSGVLRFSFALAGHPYLFYLPKALVVLALGVEGFALARDGKIARLIIGIACLLVESAVVGLFTLRNSGQVWFGLYLLLPLVFAVVAARAVLDNPQLCGKLVGILWAIAAVGVVFAWLVPAPWVGFSYQAGGSVLQASREWTTAGVPRIAGFSTASYAAAYQLLFLAIPIVILWRRRALAVSVWVMTGALLVITTTKTAVGIFAAFSIVIPIMRWQVIPRGVKLSLGASFPWLAMVVAVALPLSTLFVNYNVSFMSGIQGMLFNSFGDRLGQTWPDAFTLVGQHGSYIFGRGAGGIDTAQAIFEPNLHNPSDNIFIFGYCTFGLLFLPALLVFTRRLGRTRVGSSPVALLAWTLGVAALTAGWTVGDLQGGFGTLAIGVAAGYAFRTTGRRRAVDRDSNGDGCRGLRTAAKAVPGLDNKTQRDADWRGA